MRFGHPALPTVAKRQSFIGLTLGVLLLSTAAAAQERGLVLSGTLQPGLERAYGYRPVEGRLANVFRENGRTYSVMLIASHRGGHYVDDQIGVYDITNFGNVIGWTYPIGEFRDLCCNGAQVRIDRRGEDLWVAVAAPGASTEYEIAVKDLFMLRARSAIPRTPCGRPFLSGYQGGDWSAFTYFDASVANYLSGPAPANFRLLAPRYVIQTSESYERGGRRLPGPIPIADTGCWLTFDSNDATWYPTSTP
jgi:hypothetical protein